MQNDSPMAATRAWHAAPKADNPAHAVARCPAMEARWFKTATRMGAVVALVLASVAGGGCKKNRDKEKPAAATSTPVSTVKLGSLLQVPVTPMAMRVAKGWQVERLDGSDVPMPETPWPAFMDFNETLEVWKLHGQSPTGRVDPFILVMVDRRLPKGTKLMEYVKALHADQMKRLGARIVHAEWEKLMRNGRMGFSLRQAMNIPSPTGGTPMMQVSRIFLNGTMGIIVSAVMLEDDRPHLDDDVRAMMESIQFTKPLPREP